jgi:signal transduction histidine kinase
MIEILLRAIVAKSQAMDLLEIKHKLSLQLALAPDWNSLVNLILDFCHSQMEIESLVLLLRKPSLGCFEAVAWSQKENNSVVNNQDGVRTDIFCACDDKTENLHKFEILPEVAQELTSPSYCLPLTLGDKIIAKLNFHLPLGGAPSEQQTEIFNSCASDIAIALTSAQLSEEHADLLINKALSDQRRRVSRDLHDALAQKLVYLRLKLDQFSRSNGETRLADIHADLEQMEVAANQSYELVRGTLAVLNNDESPPLYRLLMGNSKLAADRSHLQFTFDEIGQPQVLTFEALQQVFYIFGEALNNIERHAAATKVEVTLTWEQAELAISVVDNGQGFDTAAAPQDEHYGLTTMRERAETLGGHIDFESTPSQGTSLTIRLPLGNNESNLPFHSFERT